MEEIITMDKAGRLVVPKAMRTRQRLGEGARLRIREESGERLVLEPLAEANVPVEVDGLLILRGSLVGPLPDHRDERTASQEAHESLRRPIRPGCHSVPRGGSKGI